MSQLTSIGTAMHHIFSCTENLTLPHILENMGIALFVSDRDMVCLGANRVFASFYGRSSAADLIGKTAFELYPDFKKSIFYEACEETIQTGKVSHRMGYSEKLNTFLVMRACQIGDNTYAMTVHMLEKGDVASSAVEHIDQMTSLGNRQALEKDLDRLNKSGQTVTLAVLDIKNFKNFNEAFGHENGDLCLMEVASRIKKTSSVNDRIYRISGDRFVILHNDSHLDVAPTIHELSQIFYFKGVSCVLQYHIGIASHASGEDSHLVLNHAEHAMQEAKKNKTTLTYYNDTIKQKIVYDPEFVKEIRDAIKNEHLEIHLQPQIDMIDLSVCGAEALIRWQHPEKGLIAPGLFLPMAEEAGLMIEIDQYVLKKSLSLLSEWNQKNRPIHLSINLSAASLNHPQTVSHISRLLEQHHFDRELLFIEITESAMIQDAAMSQSIIKDLKDMGLQISIDDFGTGYCSMSYLLRYPTHALKIDRSFVKDMETSDSQQIMVHNIISLAHNLGIKVVAEGVENKEQQHLLHQFGCDMAQGYLHSRPLPQQAFEEWIKGQTMLGLKSLIG